MAASNAFGTFRRERCLSRCTVGTGEPEGGKKMFEKLIESDSKQADFKDRNRYFLVSSIIVGILFLSAVVFSLYAADIDIGGADWDMSVVIAPELIEVPKPPEQLRRSPLQPSSADTPTRNSNMLRIDEVPKIPDGISVTQNQTRERPYGRFAVSDGPETDGPGIPGQGPIGTGGDPVGTGSVISERSMAEMRPDEPPPAVKKPAPPPVQSLGVINGRAVSIPAPPYPPPAKAVGVEGDVNVQVLIDESGKVVSSKAIAGHPLLKGAAEKAAWSAKFTPTKLSNQPVKVTGIIVYKFKRG